MTRFGVSIEKDTLFRGVQHPFANVYHYEIDGLAVDNTARLNELIDSIVATEKSIHATTVNFKRARCWNTGSGSQAGNQMRVDKSLSGAGSGTDIPTLDRERAFLIRWPAGFNTRGKQVYLRKWFHTCGQFTGVAISGAMQGNTAALGGTIQAAVEAKGDLLQAVSITGFPIAQLCAQSGRQRTGDSECHPYLEHHQLGDQWR